MRGSRAHVKRRGKRWVAVAELEPDPATGRRRQRQIGSFSTKREAEHAAAEAITGHLQMDSKSALAAYLADDWLPSRAHRAAQTRRQYQWATNHITTHLGAVRLDGLAPRHVQSFYQDLRDGGLSSTSITTIGKVLRMSLGDAVRRGLLTRNPAAVVQLPGVRRSEIECWSQAEALDFLSSVAFKNDRFRPLWRLALASGLRRGELVALRWKDIDFPNSRLFVRQAAALDGYQASFASPKSKASIRTVSVDAQSLEELAKWQVAQLQELELLGVSKPSLVFHREDGAAIHPQTLALFWKKMLRTVPGLPPITLHGVRHTHATLLLLAGVPLKIVSERLGHSSIQITADTYQHVLDHMQQATADEVGRLLSTQAEAVRP